MKELTWKNPNRDREGWGSGLWDDEPDKVQWSDRITGLPCLALRNHSGVWCGYVGVDRTHPYHSISYQSVNNHDLSVHGGLTYSNSCINEDTPESAICHIPDPGEPDDVWWLGFDCGHGFDYVPGMMRNFPELIRSQATYKTLDYVRGQCTLLAAQLKERMNEVSDPGV